AATSYVKENWLEAKEPWTLPVVEVAPNIDQAELDQAVKTIAEPLLSGPVTVKVDTSSVELPVEEVAAAAQIEPSEGHLVLSFNAELLMASVSKQSPVDLLTEPQDAHFAIVDGVPQIEDGVAGEGVDPDQLVDQVAKAAISTDQRVATVELIKTDPAAGRAELEKMGVKEQVSRFETIAPYNPTRTRNLVKAAELVSGTLVKPGETFSLDQALGHRSAENGWTSAGVVINGKMEEGIGGGLSQFSTTLYNASFLAGMEDVEHTPHSNWFSRYPKGREATLWEGMLDNKFKNNTPYGVVLVAGVTSDNVVWVELWSTKYWAVEAGFGEPYNYTAPRTIEDPSADCKPQAAGGSGFTIEFWRKLTLAGEVKEERTWKHTYSPINAYKCTKEG
ncbi:MAG: VanW family protein, partial [Micrococcales bacterium]|nr:VanW family protein [Micrococcales bacterium]